MSPEQARGDTLDARSDLYAVGVILYQLLTGRLPFEAESPTQVVLPTSPTSPTDPRVVAPERTIPESLVDVTLKALAKDAERPLPGRRRVRRRAHRARSRRSKTA